MRICGRNLDSLDGTSAWRCAYCVGSLTGYSDSIYRIAGQLNPEGHDWRRRKANEHRGVIVVPGPNFCWSIDAYCKLEHWGIQVYGAVDVYSRRIVWIYVGITGRSAVSVLAQYMLAVKTYGIVPSKLSSDRGGETPLGANLHLRLNRMLRQREDGLPLTFEDAFQYGTSKQNVRIETYWNQMSRTAVSRWREYFIELKEERLYDKTLIWDRIAFLAIYVKIIRHEIYEVAVGVWNFHKIRTHNRRPGHISGIPDVLYRWPQLTGGVPQGERLNLETLAVIEQELAGFGKLADPIISAEFVLTPLDIDEFLPLETLNWCN